jgi:pyruvate/2-oxoglutarate dehydrogenase complex dihydrolipoamide dehydrogenase (E3) component
LKNLDNCTVHEGHARFESPREVSIGSARIAADRIFINVGGRAVVPKMPGVGEAPFLTNSSMMEVDYLPEHLIIVGGSYIGLEFGQMFRRFGSKVTILETSDRLIKREDEDVSAAVREILEAEGVEIRLNAECIGFSKRGDAIVARSSCTEGSPEIIGSHILLAVGRRPNTDDLGLEKAGVKVDGRGYIEVDDELRTSVPVIWALGDCMARVRSRTLRTTTTKSLPLNLLDNDSRRVSDRITTYGLYIDRPLGRAGMTEAEVRRSGRPALIGKRPMTRVGRAVEKGESQGFMKVLVDARNQTDSWRRHPRHRRRRGRSLDS